MAAAGVNPVDWKTRARGGVPRRAAVHGRLGRRRRGRGGRPRRDVVRSRATGSSGCRASRGGGRVRRVRHLAVAPARPDPRRARRRRGGALPLAGLTAWQALVETAGVEAGRRACCPRRRRRRRAPRGADREGARRVGGRHGQRRPSTRSWPSSAPTRRSTTRPRPSRSVSGTSTSCSISVGGETGLRRCRRCATAGCSSPSLRRRASSRCARPPADRVRVTGILVEPDRAGLEALAGLVEAGPLRAHVERTFPLEEAAARARARRDRPHAGQARAHSRHDGYTRDGPLRPRPRRLRRRLELGAGASSRSRRRATPSRRFDLPGGGDDQTPVEERHARELRRPRLRGSGPTAGAGRARRLQHGRRDRHPGGARTARSGSQRSSSSRRSCPRTARACST